MKILLATDGSSYSDVAVKEFVRRPWPTGSEVEILSVVEPPIAATPEALYMSNDYFAESERKAQQAVEQAAAMLERREDQTLVVKTKVTSGSARQIILDEVQRSGIDLVMMGSHGYGALKRLLLGSVSQAVALHAPCSVEIVRGH